MLMIWWLHHGKPNELGFFHFEEMTVWVNFSAWKPCSLEKGILFFLTDALKEPQQLPSVCKLDIVISLTKSWIHLELLQAIKRKHFSQEAHVLQWQHKIPFQRRVSLCHALYENQAEKIFNASINFSSWSESCVRF